MAASFDTFDSRIFFNFISEVPTTKLITRTLQYPRSVLAWSMWSVAVRPRARIGSRIARRAPPRAYVPPNFHFFTTEDVSTPQSALMSPPKVRTFHLSFLKLFHARLLKVKGRVFVDVCSFYINCTCRWRRIDPRPPNSNPNDGRNFFVIIRK